jgi:hypothetical protein
MLDREIIAVYSENHKKNINRLSGQSTEFLNGKHRGAKSNHGAFSV